MRTHGWLKRWRAETGAYISRQSSLYKKLRQSGQDFSTAHLRHCSVRSVRFVTVCPRACSVAEGVVHWNEHKQTVAPNVGPNTLSSLARQRNNKEAPFCVWHCPHWTPGGRWAVLNAVQPGVSRHFCFRYGTLNAKLSPTWNRSSPG